MRHFVYILYSATLDKFYVGQSGDVAARLEYHNNPIETRKFTVRGGPWELKLTILCDDKKHAIAVEKFIKRMKSRAFIQKVLIDEKLQSDILFKTRT